MPFTREAAVAADAANPLSSFRDRFVLPDGVVYLDGNSLGARPRGALERATAVIADEWGTGLIRSWNDAGWFDLPSTLGDSLARVVGAGPGEVVVTDTTSLNLFKVLAAALRIQADADEARSISDTDTETPARAPLRTVIVSERSNFPTDLYMAEGLIDLIDGPGASTAAHTAASDTTRPTHELRLIDDHLSLAEALAPGDVAVVTLSHVDYRTGALHDMAAVTRAVHDAGALIAWDLAHSAGAVPIDLAATGADFAVGCTYKYLNGGPGAPAFVYVAPRHHRGFRQPLSGWWSHARPFAMLPAYEREPGIRQLLCGTQPIVSLAVLECGLDIALEADSAEVRRVSLELSDLFIRLVEERCAAHPLRLITPREHDRRGSHVSFEHPEGFAVMQALIARGVIGDYREPHVLRFGITPLYLGHADVWDAVEALRDILDSRSWDAPEYRLRGAVT